MTLPLVLHGVLPAVEAKLAEPFEGEVRSVPSILRMFESSCPRLFLKFERFSSLKKCRQFEELPAQMGAPIIALGDLGAHLLLPPFSCRRLATDHSPFRMNSAELARLCGDTAFCAPSLQPSLAFI
ncbi:MAG: hypothetical protein WDO17_11025 [Alphaproteobacteria bacterium]